MFNGDWYNNKSWPRAAFITSNSELTLSLTLAMHSRENESRVSKNRAERPHHPDPNKVTLHQKALELARTPPFWLGSKRPKILPPKNGGPTRKRTKKINDRRRFFFLLFSVRLTTGSSVVVVGTIATLNEEWPANVINFPESWKMKTPAKKTEKRGEKMCSWTKSRRSIGRGSAVYF